jgi:topoisomerase-4 subunit B
MSYNADSIEVLKGLDPVKMRPGMYTETNRPNHLAQEVIDNSVDEAMAGHATEIIVKVYDDGSLGVRDNGRGMPIDKHKEEGIPAYEVILTQLHSGGKFSKDAYTFSGGLHGVGISVVNALSQRLILKVQRGGRQVVAAFEDGAKVQEKGTRVEKELHGTEIRFMPDPKYFDSPRFHVPSLANLLKTKAVLCSGLKITLIEEDSGTETVWQYDNGLPDYFREKLGDSEGNIPEDGWMIHCNWGTGECDVMLAFNETEDSKLSDSFANLIPTPQGGSHLKAARQGIAAAVRAVGEQRGLIPKNLSITLEDISGGLNLIVSLRIQEPKFVGQTKEKLSNNDFVQDMQNQLRDQLEQRLHKDPEKAELVVMIAVNRAMERSKAKKKVVRKKVTSGPMLPGKLADCLNPSVDNAEIFLVEGDSAGGSAKQARDRNFQAIMPLRGKILNTWEVDISDIFGSKEISDIAVAIGMDPGSEDLSGLRYNKVCVLADADSDGLHIAVLLCALFFKHFPALVTEGHLYIALPPLFRIDQGKTVHYAHGVKEKNAIVKKLEGKKGVINVQRFKGLGEMNPDQLRETVMEPKTRNLVKIGVEDTLESTLHMNMLLGKKNADARKQWLQDNGDKVAKDAEFND